MGHIANKIDAKDKKLSEVLIGQRYRIESFQREYRWQRKHIEALINDLSNSFLRNYSDEHSIENSTDYDCYYMGPIVVCDDKNELSIVDGQQRLTSFTLLLIYLSHEIKKFDLHEDMVKDFMQYLYVKKAGKSTLVLNVESRKDVIEHLLRNPEKVFSEMDKLESLDESPHKQKIKDESIQNIISRYEDITKLFPEEINTEKTLPIFIEWLLDKVVMVEVKAYNMENAYTIFETMNDRGMSLNPTEILKGYLLSKITDDGKSDEMNDFWRNRIAEIKDTTHIDGDMDFFRAWLRAKYAESIRPTKQGAENEDFELIGTQFHAWVKNNPVKTSLKSSDDYYFFIRSDFDYYSNLYNKIYKLRNNYTNEKNILYISNFYPIADSLAYPLLMSPVSKLDDEITADDKIRTIANYIDRYTVLRTISGKSITQSSIRYSMYELVKMVRNLDIQTLNDKLVKELEKTWISPSSSFTSFHGMDNWGFYHYFFARILFHFSQKNEDFNSLMRNRKQSSYVLIRIFQNEEKMSALEDVMWDIHINSVAGYCLVRRYDLETIFSKRSVARLKYLVKQGYFPEMNSNTINNIEDPLEFIALRDDRLREMIDEIWKF